MFSAPFLAVGLLLSSTMTFASPAPIFERDTAAFDPSQYNKPDAGTPSHYFAGNSSFPVSALAKAATTGSNKLNSYPLGGGGSKKVPIYGDWSDLDGVSRCAIESIPEATIMSRLVLITGRPTWMSIAMALTTNVREMEMDRRRPTSAHWLPTLCE